MERTRVNEILHIDITEIAQQYVNNIKDYAVGIKKKIENIVPLEINETNETKLTVISLVITSLVILFSMYNYCGPLLVRI